MRKSCAIFIFSLLTTVMLHGQYNTDYGFSGGVSNYFGDIGGYEGEGRSGLADFKLDFTRWTFGAFYRHKFMPKIAMKASLNYIRLNGDDAKSVNPARVGRNLSFRNNMIELSVAGELYVYKIHDVGGTGRYTTDFNLYLFGGAGLFFNNPEGELNGTWYALQPRQTEGVKYNRVSITLPAGLGFYYTFSRKYRLGLEVGIRKTFTDYIDDISSFYIDHSNSDEITRGLANKATQEILDELPPDENGYVPSLRVYGPGKKRGGNESKDSYATITLNFSWTIKGKSKFSNSKYSSWLGTSGRRRTRKSRTKF